MAHARIAKLLDPPRVGPAIVPFRGVMKLTGIPVSFRTPELAEIAKMVKMAKSLDPPWVGPVI